MISDHHLEWAISHLEKFGGSDVFPPSHDFIAAKHNWAAIKEAVVNLVSRGTSPSTPYLGMAPKADNTFRAVHELHPLDSIAITAVIYSIAEQIERGRFPEERRCVFSFRVVPDHDGHFFKPGSENWGLFAQRRNELMTQYQQGWVLKADISDYYNQIYLHRVQNALEECLPAEKAEVAKYVHDFLHGLNAKISKGIPVGPSFSTIIAEAVLNDVDQRISSYGLDFIRWVDDIYIFHNDPWVLFNKHQELSEYLYSTHRLVFNGAKTKLTQVHQLHDFLDGSEDAVAEEHINTLREQRYSELIDELISEMNPYDHDDIDWESVSEAALEKYKDTEEFKVVANAYRLLFEQAVITNNNTLARHVLKKCTSAKIRSLAPIIREKFRMLFPFIREVAYYVRRTFNNEMLLELSAIASGFCLQNENRFSLRWLAYILTLPDYPNGHHLDDRVFSAFELRERLLLASKLKDLHRIKALRTKVDQLSEIDRHAWIIASVALTKDERNPILDHIESRGTPMDVAYCRYVKSGITSR